VVQPPLLRPISWEATLFATIASLIEAAVGPKVIAQQPDSTPALGQHRQ
jgi:hypothetical protein